jgi:hypothetical protein
MRKQIALCFGCVGEVLGYIGRILLNEDPFSGIGFNMQICCLIIAPAFFSAGIYLTLKHIVIGFGEKWSRLRPAWYTYIFIAGDLVSLVLQGAGGGIAATADDSNLQDIGTNLMIAGVVIQVVTLAAFGYLLVEYALRTYRRLNELSTESICLLQHARFRYFMGAIIVAYFGILIRCIYRIPELSGGWRSELMRDEPSFIALEGVMIVVAVAALTIFHPGYCFPALAKTIGRKRKASNGQSTQDSSTYELKGSP